MGGVDAGPGSDNTKRILVTWKLCALHTITAMYTENLTLVKRHLAQIRSLRRQGAQMRTEDRDDAGVETEEINKGRILGGLRAI